MFGISGPRTPTKPAAPARPAPANFGDTYMPALQAAGGFLLKHSPFGSAADDVVAAEDALPAIETAQAQTSTPTLPPAPTPPAGPAIEKPAPDTTTTAAIERLDVQPRTRPLSALEEKTGIPDTIRQGQYTGADLPDWTGRIDPDTGQRSVNLGNLSQAQIETDFGARRMFDARDAAERAALRQQYGDPQEDHLRAMQRTAQMESLMPDADRPLMGPGGAFKVGPGGVISGGGAVSRTRGVDPQLRLYGGQRAIDRDMQRQGIEDQIQQYGDVERGAAADLAKLRATPEYQNAPSDEARAAAEAEVMKEWVARKAALDKAHGKMTVSVKDQGGFGFGYGGG